MESARSLLNDVRSNSVNEGGNVRVVRHVLRMNQRRFAKFLHIQQQKVSNMEKKEKLEPDERRLIASRVGINEETLSLPEDELTRALINTLNQNGENSTYNVAYNLYVVPPEALTELTKTIADTVLQALSKKESAGDK